MEKLTYEELKKILEKEEVTIKDLFRLISFLEIKKTELIIERPILRAGETTTLDECRTVEIMHSKPVFVTVVAESTVSTSYTLQLLPHGSYDGVNFDTVELSVINIGASGVGRLQRSYSFTHLPPYFKLRIRNMHSTAHLYNLKVYIIY